MDNSGTILVVDDTLQSLELLTDALTAKGYEVRPASSGELALASAVADPPELVLLDIRMPGMDGFEVLRLLKGNKKLCHIPVILISAATEVKERATGFRLGAVDFIPKPFQKEELLARVRTHLELSRLNILLKQQADDLHHANKSLQEEMAGRQKAENIMRESDIKFRTVVETAPVAIFIQTNNCFAYVNPATVELFGAASPDELLGKPVIERFRPDSYAHISERLQLLNEERQALSTDESVCLKLDGSTFYLEISAVPLTYQGQNGALVFARDISKRKRAEESHLLLEQQMLNTQKLESLGVLAGGIAHDFNNILMTIMGNASLALMRLGHDSPAADNLRQIEQATDKAANLAQQMLAYSGKGKFVVESLDLSHLVEEMTQMLEASISKNALLHFNYYQGLPMVEADATQMRQIIMNLVINASEAIGDKGGIIAITTGAIDCDRSFLNSAWLEEQLPEGPYVFLEVADTGCGMEQETVYRLFDPFFTTKFTGRGLGMAAVLGIVRGHRGAIKVHSEPGKGSSFKVLLPAVNLPPEPAKAAVTDDGWQGSGTVLLVDDEEMVRAVGKQMLQALGFEVLLAADGLQALSVFTANRNISHVILDLTMPHLGGEETFRELRRLDPEVRIIMSSGYNEQEVTEKFAGKGLTGFIQKPYTLKALQEVCRK